MDPAKILKRAGVTGVTAAGLLYIAAQFGYQLPSEVASAIARLLAWAGLTVTG